MSEYCFLSSPCMLPGLSIVWSEEPLLSYWGGPMLVANSHGQGQPLQPRPDLASDSTSAQTNQIHPLTAVIKIKIFPWNHLLHCKEWHKNRNSFQRIRIFMPGAQPCITGKKWFFQKFWKLEEEDDDLINNEYVSLICAQCVLSTNYLTQQQQSSSTNYHSLSENERQIFCWLRIICFNFHHRQGDMRISEIFLTIFRKL